MGLTNYELEKFWSEKQLGDHLHVVKSEINRASDGVLETQNEFDMFSCFDQSVSWNEEKKEEEEEEEGSIAETSVNFIPPFRVIKKH